MAVTRGVLAIVADDADYARQAVNLARSIRLRDPQLPLAIATNLDPKQFCGIYDHVVPWRFDRWTGLLSKLDAPQMSPFDATLLLDVDVIAYQSLEPLFEHFAGHCFATVGSTLKPNRWFKRMAPIRALVPAAGRLTFVGAAYYFEKGADAEAIFRRAKEWNDRYDELEIRPHRVGRNEEALLAMAMFESGLESPIVRTRTCEVNLLAPNPGQFDVNVIGSRCVRFEDGVAAHQMLMHYWGDWKWSYEYLQEEIRLHMHAARRGRGDFVGALRSMWSIGDYFMQRPRKILRLRAAMSGLRKRLFRRRQ